MEDVILFEREKEKQFVLDCVIFIQVNLNLFPFFFLQFVDIDWTTEIVLGDKHQGAWVLFHVYMECYGRF